MKLGENTFMSLNPRIFMNLLSFACLASTAQALDGTFKATETWSVTLTNSSFGSQRYGDQTLQRDANRHCDHSERSIHGGGPERGGVDQRRNGLQEPLVLLDWVRLQHLRFVCVHAFLECAQRASARTVRGAEGQGRE
jgi:hypothetical protein